MTSESLLEEYLSEDEVAKLVKMKPRTLRRWRQRRDGPPFVPMGRDVLYPKDGFREWLRSRLVNPVRRRHRSVGAEADRPHA